MIVAELTDPANVISHMTSTQKQLRGHAAKPDTEWLSIRDAAKRAGVPRQKIVWLVRHGTLKAAKRPSNHVDRKVQMVRTKDLEAWAAQFPRISQRLSAAKTMPASFLTLGAILTGTAADQWRAGLAPPPPWAWIPLETIAARECDVVISLDDYLVRANVLLLRRHIAETQDAPSPSIPATVTVASSGPRLPLARIVKC